MTQYTRREFFGLMSKGAAGLALAGGLGSLGSLLTACGRGYPVCASTLHQVRSGAVSPHDYVQERQHCLPDAAKAKNSGMLKGFTYEPSDKEIEGLLREVLSSGIADEQLLQRIIQNNIHAHRSSREKSGTIMPTSIEFFGQKIPLYVVFTRELFSPPINNDADVNSIVRHELKHVEDWYSGIRLEDVHISYDTISPGTFRPDFLAQLMELRAVYKELEDIFRERVERGTVSVSDWFFGSRGTSYIEYWDFLAGYPATDLERKTRELQFEQSGGIVPKSSNDEILITFNLFGKRDTATIVRA